MNSTLNSPLTTAMLAKLEEELGKEPQPTPDVYGVRSVAHTLIEDIEKPYRDAAEDLRQKVDMLRSEAAKMCELGTRAAANLEQYAQTVSNMVTEMRERTALFAQTIEEADRKTMTSHDRVIEQVAAMRGLLPRRESNELRPIGEDRIVGAETH